MKHNSSEDRRGRFEPEELLERARRRGTRIRRRRRLLVSAGGLVSAAAVAVVVVLVLVQPRPEEMNVQVVSPPAPSTQSAGQPTTSTTSSPATTTTPGTSSSAVPPPAPVGGEGAPVPTGFVPLSFTAVSASHWWVLGTQPCGSERCLGIETTSSAGASFRQLPAPGSSFVAGSTPPATGIRFADPHDGWVYGGHLYATHDGGLTWSEITTPGDVTELEPGLGEVFAVVTPPVPACAETATCTAATPAPQLWRAEPSGDAWSVDAAAGTVTGGLAVHQRSVWIVDATTSPDGPALGDRLRHSDDDGANFTLEPEPVGGVSCSYSPVSEAVVWAYCSGGNFMDAGVSTNGGADFTPVPATTGGSPSADGQPNGSGLVAASPDVAVAAGSLAGSPLLRTADGGATWTVAQTAPNASGTWSLVGFTTPEVGYALWSGGGSGAGATTRLWRSTDAGRTWAPVPGLP